MSKEESTRQDESKKKCKEGGLVKKQAIYMLLKSTNESSGCITATESIQGHEVTCVHTNHPPCHITAERTDRQTYRLQ